MSTPPDEIGKKVVRFSAVDKTAKRWEPPEYVSKKKARPETRAEAMAFLHNAGVDHLPENHPDRRKAFTDWVRWAMRNPAPNPNIDPNDPVLKGPPKGWKGVL